MTKRAQPIKKLLEHFWKRFQNQYSTEPRERHKNINRSTKREIKVGELVLISDENLQRHRWRVAVVEGLISSKDGHVRGCRLRITNNKSKISTYINRPANKLCPLEITSKQSEKEPKIRFVAEKTIPKMNIE